MNQARKAKQQHWNHKALVLGRIGIIRSLGREEIPVAVAQESVFTFERASRSSAHTQMAFRRGQPHSPANLLRSQ